MSSPDKCVCINLFIDHFMQYKFSDLVYVSLCSIKQNNTIVEVLNEVQYKSCVSYTMFHSQNNIMINLACQFLSIVLGMMHLLQFHTGCICPLPS